jgi:hypothetical protein
MYVGVAFSPMDVGENEVFGLDFINDLPTGDSILSSSFTLIVDQGIDSNPSAHLNGAPGVGGTIALQRISGLLGGVNYLLQATVLTTLGNTISLNSFIRCITPS